MIVIFTVLLFGFSAPPSCTIAWKGDFGLISTIVTTDRAHLDIPGYAIDYAGSFSCIGRDSEDRVLIQRGEFWRA